MIYYPEKADLEIDKETVLCKIDDFSISMKITGESEDKYYCYYKYNLYLTDNDENKILLMQSHFSKDIYLENPLQVVQLFSEESPIILKDIDLDGNDEYIFVIESEISKIAVVLSKEQSLYKILLSFPIHTYGGPESDDVARGVYFNQGESQKDIFIDYKPYNKRSYYTYDENSQSYVQKYDNDETKYLLKKYYPDFPLTIKQFGEKELAFTDSSLYLKKNDEYNKIYFDGDRESWGGFTFDKENINVYDFDQDSFLVQLSYKKTDSYKDQFFIIYTKNGKDYLTSSNERYINSIGINKNENTLIEVIDFKHINDYFIVSYNVLDKTTMDIINSYTITILEHYMEDKESEK